MIIKPSDFKFAVNIPSRMTSQEDLNILLGHMVKEGASDLFLCGDDYAWISRGPRKVRITRRIITAKEVVDMLTSFYGINAMSKLGMPEAIDIDLDYKEVIETNKIIRHRYRVNAVNAKVNARLVPDLTIRSIASQPPKHEDLNIPEEIMNIFINSKQGLFLMVGSTGSGKSTTLAAMIRGKVEQPDANLKLVTVEKPIEYVYDDIEKPSSIVRQFQVGQSVVDFSDGLRNALRQAPDDILIGEARDLETISLATEACVTGHFVSATVHSNSVAETIPRMVNPFPDSSHHKVTQELIQSMTMIVAQTLCPTIDGKRVALREWLHFTPEIKNILSSSKNITKDLRVIVSKYGNPMYKSALVAFNDGVISKEELDKIELTYGSGE